MENKGKANIKVEFSREELPFLQKNANWSNGDFQSRSYDSQIEDSEYLMPTLIEVITDPKGKIHTIIPQKRKVYVNNFLRGFEGTPVGEGVPYLVWEPLDIYLNDTGWGIIKDMAADYLFTSTSNPDGTCNNEGNEGGAGSTSSTKCSKWMNTSYPAVSLPHDGSRVLSIQDYIINNGVDCEVGDTADTELEGEGEEEEEEEEGEDTSIPSLGYVNQTQALHGLFWGVESEAFLNTNMPFWVNIKRTAFSPSGDKYEGVLVISLGVSAGDDSSGGESQQFDLILSENNKAELVDYWFGREALEGDGETGEKKRHTPGSGSDPVGLEDEESAPPPPPYSRKTFDSDSARILRDQTDIEIGFMTISGRLVVFVNGETLIYNRVDPGSGAVAECKIAAAPIRVYGTNHQAAINVSFMSFAELGAFSLMGPSVAKDSTERLGPTGPLSGGDSKGLQAVKPDGSIGGTVAELPAGPESKGKGDSGGGRKVGDGGDIKLDTGGGKGDLVPSSAGLGAGGNKKGPPVVFGVDSETFSDDNGETQPEGFGFHQEGAICFRLIEGSGSKNQDGKNYYIVTLRPSDTIAKEDSTSLETGDPIPIPNGGCPYYFRLAGATEDPKPPSPDWTDASEDVISATQTEGLDSTFTVGVKSASITLYNKNGKYDFLRGLQAAWRIYFSWCSDEVELTFTGVHLGVSTAETPGDETITFQLKDYTHCLQSNPIINSPAFDGMYSYSAIELLSKMVGLIDTDIQWPDKNAYWLPEAQAGTSQKPSVKFEPMKSIYDCMVWIAEMDQSNFYFNEEGRLVLRKIPGGLLFDTGGLSETAEFVRSPEDFENGLGHLILDEKREEFSLASTCSEVNIFGMRKDLKAPYHAKVTPADVDPAPPNVILYTRRLFLVRQALQTKAIAQSMALELGNRVFWPIKNISIKVVGFVSDGGAAPQVLDLVKVDGNKYRVTDIERTYDAAGNDFTISFSCKWRGGKS